MTRMSANGGLPDRSAPRSVWVTPDASRAWGLNGAEAPGGDDLHRLQEGLRGVKGALYAAGGEEPDRRARLRERGRARRRGTASRAAATTGTGRATPGHAHQARPPFAAGCGDRGRLGRDRQPRPPARRVQPRPRCGRAPTRRGPVTRVTARRTPSRCRGRTRGAVGPRCGWPRRRQAAGAGQHGGGGGYQAIGARADDDCVGVSVGHVRSHGPPGRVPVGPRPSLRPRPTPAQRRPRRWRRWRRSCSSVRLGSWWNSISRPTCAAWARPTAYSTVECPKWRLDSNSSAVCWASCSSRSTPTASCMAAGW